MSQPLMIPIQTPVPTERDFEHIGYMIEAETIRKRKDCPLTTFERQVSEWNKERVGKAS